MSKNVKMFGRKSLEQARQFVKDHPNRELVILKNAQSWRIAVCSPRLAEELATKGFRPIE